MQEIKLSETLAANGFNFKKQFGQNFITDGNLLDGIVDDSGICGGLAVEIGCGAGTLTRAIAKKADKVLAFEIDKDLQPVLAVTLAGAENCEVIFRDFMKVNMAEFEKKLPPYTVVANLPYYITTPLVMKFIEQSQKCVSLTVMVQEEVAERFCSHAGTPEYGAITASIALRGRCRIVRRVPRTMFYPRPNVDSAVVRIDIFEGNVKVQDADTYKKVVRAAFSSRRKTLENNLMQYFKVKRDKAREWLTSAGIDYMIRGEELSPERFAALADVIYKG
ncbi:MAG: 16S rRNA (adenine(1518)-N(6)/adenine(1519)-N(6))-dimethyltransferase RsmA [Clostridia bacterium]|nr:16S rRNA (adenine(1518)-N(6)/adenine(1519)-N(6))-dimethyltransferase RsmA [Clostridia bacterium]